jgi:hypothetical protein
MISKRFKILFLFFVFALSISSVNAQGGSNYTIFGLGDININAGASYEGLAGTSIAFPTSHSVNPLNPSLWAEIKQTRLMTGYKFNQNLVEDVNNNILYQNNGKISGISTIFVIDTSMGIAASLGINPYSSVNYLISVPIDVKFEEIEVTGQTNYRGYGGISMAYLGGSVKILNNLSFGASAFATFGVITSRITTSFNDEKFFTSIQNNENKFNGYGFRTGMFYEPIEGLSLGIFTEQHQQLELENQITYTSELQNDTTLTDELNISLPNAYGAGISYLTGKFRIGLDVKLYQFSDLTFNKGPNTEFRNMKVYSLGVSRMGNEKLGADYLDRVTYNFGVGYKQLYYNINGKGIDDVFASFGMNFPLVGSAIIDAAFTLGSRGIKTEKLVHEYYGRLSIDISIGETWFKPFRREY